MCLYIYFVPTGLKPLRRTCSRRSRLLHDRRDALSQTGESIKTRQPINPAGHGAIEKLQASLSAKQSGNDIVRVAFGLGALTYRRPEALDDEVRQVARKLCLTQFHSLHVPEEV